MFHCSQDLIEAFRKLYLWCVPEKGLGFLNAKLRAGFTPEQNKYEAPDCSFYVLYEVYPRDQGRATATVCERSGWPHIFIARG